MIRWLPIFFLAAFTSCYGTLDMEDGGTFEDDSAALASGPAAASPQTGPADTGQPPATTPAPTTTTTEPPPAEEPIEEPPMEEEPAPEPEEPALPEPGSIVEFQISQGTGTSSWNTAADPVVVYVGQVLKLTNFDDRDHRMHAASAAGVPHGDTLRPGQSEEYVVSSAMTIGAESLLWDHNDGRSAAFWVEAREYPTP